jgi:hypothetical protein
MKNKTAVLCLTALTLILALLFGLTGCGPVKPNGPTGGDTSSLEQITEPSGEPGSRGDPLARPAANQKPNKANVSANVFICGERSMMGFADWKYDTVFETAVSLLADELNSYSASFYRYDGYDSEPEDMQIPDAAKLKDDIRNVGFYTSEGVSPETSIPSDVKRYNSDKLETLSGIAPWLSAEQLDAVGAKNAYPLENAIKNFKIDALNVIVTDFYELRNGSLRAITVLQDYDVGLIAIQSEYSGVLPGFLTTGEDFIWGSPTTGAYKSHSVKSASYTKQDGTTGYYNYNVFQAYSSEERVSEERTFYVLFAGNAESVAAVMNGVSSKLADRYANSTTVSLQTDTLLIQNGFYSAVCEDIKTDTSGAAEYIGLEYGEGYTDAFGFEIREADEIPPLRVSAKYPVGADATDRMLTVNDFNIISNCIKLGASAAEYDVYAPKFTLEDGGSGFVIPTLTYNPDELPAGEYVYETRISVFPPEQSKAEAEFLNTWGINVDDGSLRQWVQSYLNGEQDGVEKMRGLMTHTLGLGNVFEPLNTEASERDILAVRVYFIVV